jgi:hypothetical protein
LAGRIQGASFFYNANSNVLSAGTATTETAVSTAAVVPPNASQTYLNVSLVLTGGGAASGENMILRTVSGSNLYLPRIDTPAGTNTNGAVTPTIPNVNQNFYYLWQNIFGTPASRNSTIDVIGFAIPNGST